MTDQWRDGEREHGLLERVVVVKVERQSGSTKVHGAASRLSRCDLEVVPSHSNEQ